MLLLPKIVRFGLPAAAVLLAFAVLNFYPGPLFAYTRSYHGFVVASDNPIDPAIDLVLDDAQRRLSTSGLYHPEEPFRVYICNHPWRLRLFTFNANIGGGTVWATHNIFIRTSDIAGNRLISPSGGPLLDARDRPLSYFIAHEATHVLELRQYGLWAMLRSPFWLTEGYADLVGKGGNFDAEANRVLLMHNDPLLSEKLARNGLYRRYHLMVATQLRRPDASINAMFASPPAEQKALSDAERGSPN